MIFRTFTCLLAFVAVSAATALANEPEYDVPFVPTPQEVVEEMLNLASVTADDYVIDLGSGDGRIVITAAKKHGARALGVEINPILVNQSKRAAREAGLSDRATFVEADIFEVEIREATVITMYLLSSVNLKLRPRLLAELAPGTRIVSHAFDMGEWKPHERINAGHDGRYTLYYWVIPARVEGDWEVASPGDPAPIELMLSQNYQEIHGFARINYIRTPLRNGRVDGDQITFVVPLPGQNAPGHFEGRVQNGEIQGTVTIEGAQQPPMVWHARRK